jgi:hypothetical protein
MANPYKLIDENGCYYVSGPGMEMLFLPPSGNTLEQSRRVVELMNRAVVNTSHITAPLKEEMPLLSKNEFGDLKAAITTSTWALPTKREELLRVINRIAYGHKSAPLQEGKEPWQFMRDELLKNLEANLGILASGVDSPLFKAVEKTAIAVTSNTRRY